MFLGRIITLWLVPKPKVTFIAELRNLVGYSDSYVPQEDYVNPSALKKAAKMYLLDFALLQ